MARHGSALSDADRQRIYARLGARAPRTTIRAIFRHFCTPPRVGPGADVEARLVEKMTPLFARADWHEIPCGRDRIAAYHWRLPPSGAPSGVPGVAVRGRVLLVHGWTGRAMIMGLFVDLLLRAGYDVVALDFPAHGMSSGRRLNLPIGKQAILAVAARLGPFTAAISHSFGGPVLATALETGPPIPECIDLDRLVLIAAPNRLDAMIDAFVRRFQLSPKLAEGLKQRVAKASGRDLDEVEVGKFLPKVGVPTLLIHATDDEDVLYDRALAILATTPNACLLTLDGLGHKRIIISSMAIRAAVAFVGGTEPQGVTRA